MLPKKYRLTVFSFNQLPQKTSEVSSSYLGVKIKKKEGIGKGRFTIIVPKFLDKRSSYRHLTKRIIEEAVRSILGKIKKPVFILLKAKKIIKKGNNKAVSEEMESLFKKTDLL